MPITVDVNERSSPAPEPVEPSWLRQTEIIIYGFLFTCVTLGLAYLVPAALEGRVWNAVVVAAVVIGGSGATLIMQAIVRVAALMLHNAEQLDTLRQRIDSLEDALEAALSIVPERNAAAAASATDVNLSELGDGDPTPLIAAAAVDEPFPRLAVTPPPREPRRHTAAAPPRPTPDAPDPPVAGPEERWQRAFDAGDIAKCRRVLAEAGGRIPAPRRQAMADALSALLEDRKQTLRDEFAALVRAREYGKAIEKGRQIAETFPNTTMAADFHRLQPHLAARAKTASPRAAKG
jgi:hypothetical protein